ncbi:MAG TPA: hypothetical protein VHL57_05750 [Flavobacteriales bacterium]|jgi:hypothetical protein|nr:hypothetical protein [Flavobacteriales bacterium]
MKYVLPIAAMICTAGATLLMLVFTMAGMANSTPEQLRSMKWWAGGLSLLSLACVTIGALLLRQGRSELAALVAFLPTAIMGTIFLVQVLK